MLRACLCPILLRKAKQGVWCPRSSFLPSPPLICPGPSHCSLMAFVSWGGHPQKEKRGVFPKWFICQPPSSQVSTREFPWCLVVAMASRALNSEIHIACESSTGTNSPLHKGAHAHASHLSGELAGAFSTCPTEAVAPCMAPRAAGPRGPQWGDK